jgi:hypothetical protein
MKLYHSLKDSYAGTYIHRYIHFCIDRLVKANDVPLGETTSAKVLIGYCMHEFKLKSPYLPIASSVRKTTREQ